MNAARDSGSVDIWLIQSKFSNLRKNPSSRLFEIEDDAILSDPEAVLISDCIDKEELRFWEVTRP